MEIRKLATYEELLESARVIDTAFLHPWNEEESAQEARAQAAGERPGCEAWGLFDDDGKMMASVSTLLRTLSFGGERVPAGELHMVGSLPEGRGGGNVRALIAAILDDFKARGCVFALLIPFSFAFYRKFGFEQATGYFEQRVPIDQLSGLPCPYRVRQLTSEDELVRLRAFADAFAASRNMAEIRPDAAWRWNGSGDYGEPDFMHQGCPRYAYLLEDEQGELHAYLRFLFTHEPANPFVGELVVDDIAYDSPEALLGALGFLYGMRAKVSHVRLDLLDDYDLGLMLPECDKVERSRGGHMMARLLDVERALALMPHPAGEGCYTLGVTDDFMPQNSGCYQVRYGEDGTTVNHTDAADCDLELSEQTLVQLVSGLAGLDDALLRAGTCLRGNEATLRQVFCRRAVCLR